MRTFRTVPSHAAIAVAMLLFCAASSAFAQSPGLISPDNGSCFYDVDTVRLVWELIGSADSSLSQVSKSSNFSTIVNEQNTTDTTVVVPALELGTRYYWRVYTYKEGHLSNSPNSRSFWVLDSLHITCPDSVQVSCLDDIPSVCSNTTGVGIQITGGKNPQLSCSRHTTHAGSGCPGDSTEIVDSFFVEDDCGARDSCAIVYTIKDDVPPILSCPTSVSATESAPGAGAFVHYTVTAGDNCTANPSITYDHKSDSTYAAGTWLVTCIAKDDCDNRDTCWFNVIVSPLDFPEAKCKNVSKSANSQCQATVTPAEVDNGSTGVGLTLVRLNPAGPYGLGVTPVWLVVKDGFTPANYDSCQANITVTDNTAPDITCTTPSFNVSANSNCQWAVPNYSSSGPYTLTDNCGATVTQKPAAATLLGLGTHTIWVIATDNANNKDSCSFNVTVQDNTAPDITCNLTNETVSANANCLWSVLNYTSGGAFTATDNCGISSISQRPAAGSTLGLGVHTIWLIATDNASNKDSCSFSVTVEDDTAPAITCSIGVDSVAVDDNCVWNIANYVDDSAFSVSDNCGANVTQRPAATTAVGTGSYTVWLIAADDAGNKDSCSFSLVVRDTTKPTVACPAPITISCLAQLPVPIPQLLPVDDNCGVKSVTHVGDVPITGDTCSGYTIARTYEVMDVSDNVTECTQLITVHDEIAPEITTFPPDTTIPSLAEIPDADTDRVEAIDDCSAVTVKWEGDEVVLEQPGCGGEIERTYSVTDECGNALLRVQRFIANDDVFPTVYCDSLPATIPGCPPPIPPAYDNCRISDEAYVSGTVINVPPDPCANGFQVEYTYAAWDPSGNRTECTDTFTVFDATPPEQPGVVDPNYPNLPFGYWTCERDFSISLPLGAADDCGLEVGFIKVEGLGDVDSMWRFTTTQDVRLEGLHIVSIAAVDGCGNQSVNRIHDFTVDVNDPPTSINSLSFAEGEEGVCKPLVIQEYDFTDNSMFSKADSVLATGRGSIVDGKYCPPTDPWETIPSPFTVGVRCVDGCGNVDTLQLTVSLPGTPELSWNGDWTGDGVADAVVFNEGGSFTIDSITPYILPVAARTVATLTNCDTDDANLLCSFVNGAHGIRLDPADPDWFNQSTSVSVIIGAIGYIPETLSIPVTVNPVNDAPHVTSTAHGFVLINWWDKAGTFAFPSNWAEDVDNTASSLTWNVLSSDPSPFSVQRVTGNSFAFEFQPNAVSTATATFQVKDPGGLAAASTVDARYSTVRFSPIPLTFPETEVGSKATTNINLNNGHNEMVTFHLSQDHSDITLLSTTVTVGPGATQQVGVEWEPSRGSPTEDIIRITVTSTESGIELPAVGKLPWKGTTRFCEPFSTGAEFQTVNADQPELCAEIKDLNIRNIGGDTCRFDRWDAPNFPAAGPFEFVELAPRADTTLQFRYNPSDASCHESDLTLSYLGVPFATIENALSGCAVALVLGQSLVDNIPDTVAFQPTQEGADRDSVVGRFTSTPGVCFDFDAVTIEAVSQHSGGRPSNESFSVAFDPDTGTGATERAITVTYNPKQAPRANEIARILFFYQGAKCSLIVKGTAEERDLELTCISNPQTAVLCEENTIGSIRVQNEKFEESIRLDSAVFTPNVFSFSSLDTDQLPLTLTPSAPDDEVFLDIAYSPGTNTKCLDADIHLYYTVVGAGGDDVKDGHWSVICAPNSKICPAFGTYQSSVNALAFGAADVGDTVMRSVSIGNTGTAPFTINSCEVVNENDSCNCEVIQSTISGAAVPAVNVYYAPRFVKNFTGTLKIYTSAFSGSCSGGLVKSISLTGSGIDTTGPDPWPSSVTLNEQIVGQDDQIEVEWDDNVGVDKVFCYVRKYSSAASDPGTPIQGVKDASRLSSEARATTPFTISVPSTYATTDGYEYRMVAIDKAGNPSDTTAWRARPLQFAFSPLPVGQRWTIKRSDVTDDQRWYAVGFPGDLDQTSIQGVLVNGQALPGGSAYGNEGSWYVWKLSPGSNSIVSEGDLSNTGIFSRGNSVWLGFRKNDVPNELNLSALSGRVVYNAADTTADVTLSLDSDWWTMITNPYYSTAYAAVNTCHQNIYLASSTGYGGGAVVDTAVSTGAFVRAGSQAYAVLEPFKSYFVLGLGNQLTITPHVPDGAETCTAPSPSSSGMSVTLLTGSTELGTLVCGADLFAADGLDAYDRLMLPTPSAKRLYVAGEPWRFDGQSLALAADWQSLSDQRVTSYPVGWNLPGGMKGTRLALRFANTMPPVESMSYWLYDRADNRTVEISDGMVFEFAADAAADARRFVILLANARDVGQWESSITENLPREYRLHQPYPNPFNAATQVEFEVAQYGRVEVDVWNVLGQRVSSLWTGETYPGRYTVIFDTHRDARWELASGVYFVRLTAPGYSETRKIVLMK